MAGQGILIRFASEIRDFLAGKNKVRSELKDVGTGLDDVGEQGEDAGDKITGGLDDVSDGADDASGKLGKLGDVGREVLDGDIGGAAQSAAGALTALGPAGALAGTVAAAGIGLIGAELEKRQDQLDQLQTKFATMYRAAADEGRTFLDQAQIQSEALDILFNPDRADELAQARKDAERTGLRLNDILKAQAGDQQALNDVLAVGNSLLDDATAKQETLQGAVRGDSPLLRDALGTVNVLKDMTDRYTAIGDAITDNAQKADQAQGIIAELEAAHRDQIDRTAATDQARWEALAANIAAQSGKRVVIPVDVDTSGAERDLTALLGRRRNINVGVHFGKEVIP